MFVLKNVQVIMQFLNQEMSVMMNVCIMRMLQLVNNFVYKLVVKKICIMYNNQEIIV